MYSCFNRYSNHSGASLMSLTMNQSTVRMHHSSLSSSSCSMMEPTDAEKDTVFVFPSSFSGLRIEPLPFLLQSSGLCNVQASCFGHQ